MMLAQALDESRYIKGLCSAPMSDQRDTLGKRLLAAVIPAHFKDLNAVHLASGIAYSTVHVWKSGKSNPRWEQVEAIAALIGANPFRLVAAAEVAARAQRVGDHPGWPAAVARAIERFRDRVPHVFYEIAAETQGARVPEEIDENFAYELAYFWWKHAQDSDLRRADTAAASRELDELRAATKAPRP